MTLLAAFFILLSFVLGFILYHQVQLYKDQYARAEHYANLLKSCSVSNTHLREAHAILLTQRARLQKQVQGHGKAMNDAYYEGYRKAKPTEADLDYEQRIIDANLAF